MSTDLSTHTYRQLNPARIVTGAFLGLLVALGLVLVGPANSASAATTVDCGYSNARGDTISVTNEDDGTFKIQIVPGVATRAAGPGDAVTNTVTNELWHAVQECQPGLYGSLADSIYQQLQCHVWGGPAFFATGPTYDLESYHAPLATPDWTGYAASHCLNEDGGARVYQDPSYGNIA